MPMSQELEEQVHALEALTLTLTLNLNLTLTPNPNPNPNPNQVQALKAALEATMKKLEP